LQDFKPFYPAFGPHLGAY